MKIVKNEDGTTSITADREETEHLWLGVHMLSLFGVEEGLCHGPRAETFGRLAAEIRPALKAG
jgi:hypothetical protein